MILSDKTIEKLLAEGSLAIEPLEPEQIQPASVDIRLGDTFGIVEDTPSGIVGPGGRDRLQDDPHRPLHPAAGPVRAGNHHGVRAPGRDLTAFVEGRSSLGRMGLFVQNAVGWIRASKARSRWSCSTRTAARWSCARAGAWGQLVFAQLDEAAKNPYAGKYQGQRGATGSRVYLDPEAAR